MSGQMSHEQAARLFETNAKELAHKLLQAADLIGGELSYDWKLNIYEYVKAFVFGEEVIATHEAGQDPASSWDLFNNPKGKEPK